MEVKAQVNAEKLLAQILSASTPSALAEVFRDFPSEIGLAIAALPTEEQGRILKEISPESLREALSQPEPEPEEREMLAVRQLPSSSTLNAREIVEIWGKELKEKDFLRQVVTEGMDVLLSLLPDSPPAERKS